MKKIISIFVLIFAVFSIGKAAKTELTLAEKISMARQMADDAAEGKAEMGRVVSGEFDFEAEVKKFRQRSGISDVNIEENSDITSDTPKSEPAEPVVAPIVKENVAPALTATKAALETVEPMTPDEVKSTKPDEAELPKPNEKKSPQYVVDTSKDFVNGHFVGNIDGTKTDEVKLPKKSEKKYFESELTLFHLMSDNQEAISTPTYVAKECEDMIAEYFAGGQKMSFARKIMVQIISDKNIKMESPVAASIDDFGVVTLSVRWDENLKLESYCKLLASSALRKIALDEAGVAAMSNVPYWLDIAMGVMLEQRVRLGVSLEQAAISEKSPPPNLIDVLKYSKDTNLDINIKESHSLWTLVSISKLCKSHEHLSQFMRKAIVAKSPENIEARAREIMPNDFDLRWRCLITGEIFSRLGGVMTMETSETELIRFAVVQSNSGTNERVGITDSAIWISRNSIRQELELRVIEIKIALPRINPLYFDALVSLGEMYDAALDDDEDDFNKAYQNFLSEFKMARGLSFKIKDAIAAK